jgi:hypothetical protein
MPFCSAKTSTVVGVVQREYSRAVGKQVGSSGRSTKDVGELVIDQIVSARERLSDRVEDCGTHARRAVEAIRTRQERCTREALIAKRKNTECVPDVQTTDACFRVHVPVTTNYGEAESVPDGVRGVRDRRGSAGNVGRNRTVLCPLSSWRCTGFCPECAVPKRGFRSWPSRSFPIRSSLPPDCDSGCRGFESHQPPQYTSVSASAPTNFVE